MYLSMLSMFYEVEITQSGLKEQFNIEVPNQEYFFFGAA